MAQEMADMRRVRVLRSKPRIGRKVPSLDDLAGTPALAVFAHPDDEVIAAGTLLGRLPRAGVICMTNGAPLNEDHARRAGFDNWMDYGMARQREAEKALALLGREIAPYHNLGITDLETTFHLVSASRHLAHQLRAGFTHVVTHAYEGGHPDHDSTAFCVHAACTLIARDGGAPPVIVEAPLYSAANGEFEYRKFLPHPDAGPVTELEASLEEQARKRRMFECHASQGKILSSFGVERELFRLAPRYHFSAPPHAGAVGYDRYHWHVSGRVWRGQARRAMRALNLLEDLA
jgi:LmbE family N-acetylglucosaminyl deacetylase